jgi:CysZ protein
MLSLEYADYPMGNHNLHFRAERSILRQQRPLALGFGAAVSVMTTIPIVNFLAMPVAVAGATAMWVDRLQEKVDMA